MSSTTNNDLEKKDKDRIASGNESLASGGVESLHSVDLCSLALYLQQLSKGFVQI